MRTAVVERCRHQRAHQRDETAYRIVGALGISDVALLSGDDQDAVERAAPAYLDGVAHRIRIARLPQDAVIEAMAVLARPFEQFHRSVLGDALLVSGDEE